MGTAVALLRIIVIDSVVAVQNIKGAASGNQYTDSGMHLATSVGIAVWIISTFGESARQAVGGLRTIVPRLGEMHGRPNTAPNGVDIFPFVSIVFLSVLSLIVDIILVVNRPTLLAIFSCVPAFVSFVVQATISYRCW
jgi:hypothetical protein